MLNAQCLPKAVEGISPNRYLKSSTCPPRQCHVSVRCSKILLVILVGIGYKELWEIDPAKHHPGYTEHTLGWPLRLGEYGGSFLYHIDDNGQKLVRIGFITGLDYKDLYINTFRVYEW